MISKALMICLVLTTFPVLAARTGGESGGGGDASEVRVNEIRADILSWIEIGGAKELKLPEHISYGQYVDDMSEILKPKKVIVGFTDEKILVKKVEKTCKGFFAEVSSQPNILCNISRFKNTSESHQYQLIHHEYAGLVNIEKNMGAASDYEISSQLTDYLENKKVLKLSIKKFAVKKTSRKDHYIEEFERGSIPSSLSRFYGQTVACSDIDKPDSGFAGTFGKHGTGIALIMRGQNLPYDILMPIGNNLQGNLSLIRESTSGEIIMIGMKKFLGFQLKANPDEIDLMKVQVLTCDFHEFK